MIYITGGAGVGKFYLLNKINILYETIWHKNVKITALTGVAAILVKGTTVHSTLRINDELEESQIIKRLQPLTQIQKIISGYDIIIVDEISMMSATLYKQLDLACHQCSLDKIKR